MLIVDNYFNFIKNKTKILIEIFVDFLFCTLNYIQSNFCIENKKML